MTEPVVDAAGDREGACIAYVVGARPNYVKMAPVIAEMRDSLPSARHVLINTGQHYDPVLSRLFLEVLGMPEPDHELQVGSGSHALQIARVIERIEPVLIAEAPDLVVVPGDVNSTLAAGVVASRLGIGLVHLEAGLRSFDRSMPEEVNRILVDRISDLLLVHSPEAVGNLVAEGVDSGRVRMVGNTMIDSLVAVREQVAEVDAAGRLGVEPGSYLLVTLHRPALVDGPLLEAAMSRLGTVAQEMPVVFPVHPRTRVRLDETGIPDGVIACDPLGYLDFLSLQSTARAVLTDSGGVQEETTFLGVPCFTLRDNTERPVTISVGSNVLLGLDPVEIETIPLRLANWDRECGVPEYWDGRASVRAALEITTFLDQPEVARAGGAG